MTSFADLIVSAACGETRALNRFARHDRILTDVAAPFSAILVCDADPPPLAALLASATNDPPPAVLAMPRRVLPDALRLLLTSEGGFARRALLWRLPIVFDRLGDPPDAPTLFAWIRTAVEHKEETLAATIMRWLGAARWRDLPEETRAERLNVVCRRCESAASGGGAVWSALNTNERIRIAWRAAESQSTFCAL